MFLQKLPSEKCSQVEKYYTGPESSPTGYPLPAVSEHEDSNHAPPVDVKVGDVGTVKRDQSYFCSGSRPAWQLAVQSRRPDSQLRERQPSSRNVF